MTYQDIIERLQITEAHATEALMKLCAPKSQVLLKEKSKVPKFSKDEIIKVNEEFKSNNIRLMLKPIQTAKAAAGGGGVTPDVLKERA
jgi:hypothetical protein